MADRSMPVPDGLAGMRVDARAGPLAGTVSDRCAALAEEGARSKLVACRPESPIGSSPAPCCRCGWRGARAATEHPIDIEGMTILYSDDDIVAVDRRQLRRACVGRPRTGPDGARRIRRRVPDPHIRNARAAGHRASPRRDLRGDGDGDLRAGVHRAEAGVQTARCRPSGTTRWFKDIQSAQRNDRRSVVIAAMNGSSASPGENGGTALRTTCWKRSGNQPILSTLHLRKLAAPTRSSCTSPRYVTMLRRPRFTELIPS